MQTLANFFFFFFWLLFQWLFLHLLSMHGAEIGEIIHITFIFKLKICAPFVHPIAASVFQFLDVYNCSLTKMTPSLSPHEQDKPLHHHPLLWKEPTAFFWGIETTALDGPGPSASLGTSIVEAGLITVEFATDGSIKLVCFTQIVIRRFILSSFALFSCIKWGFDI